MNQSKAMKSYDVIIIGAGPAGTSAATLLAKEGLHVLILEKEKFPRYSVGESLLPHFWKFADLLGVTVKIEEEGFIKKGGAAVFWNNKLKIVKFGNMGHERPGLHVERSAFDNILLNHAKSTGVDVLEECKVTSIQINKASNKVTYECKEHGIQNVNATFLIDASGQAALVNKQLGTRNFDPNFRFQAFWGYFDQSDYIGPEGHFHKFDKRYEKSPMSMISSTGEWGWSWNLLLKKQVSVGVLVPKQQITIFKNGGSTIEDRFISWTKKTPIFKKILNKSHLISEVRTMRDYSYLPTTLVTNQCFIIGDAASFADPINSQGVTMGMYGGMLAAWSIKNCFFKQSRIDFYQKLFVENMRTRLAVFQLLSYPQESIPSHLIKSCKELISNQSLAETNIILAHLMATSRSLDFSNFLENMNIPIYQGWQDVKIPE